MARHRTLLRPRDNLLAVTREFIHEGVSRSGLDRCPRRHGVADLPAPQPREASAKPSFQPCKDAVPGGVPVDVKDRPRLPDQDQRCYRLVASNRATRWV